MSTPIIDKDLSLGFDAVEVLSQILQAEMAKIKKKHKRNKTK